MALNEIVDELEPEEVSPEIARENRKATGRQVALMIALFIILIALYHIWLRKNAVLAGVVVPAFIMVLYAVWVIHTSKRDKKRRRKAEEEAKKEKENAAEEELKQAKLKKFSTTSNPAMVSFSANPSTSKVILIHPMSRDPKDPRFSTKSIRNDLKTSNQSHGHQKQQGAKSKQSTKAIPSIEIMQIPPYKNAQISSNLLPTVHLKNEKSNKKSRSLEKKNLAGNAIIKN